MPYNRTKNAFIFTSLPSFYIYIFCLLKTIYIGIMKTKPILIIAACVVVLVSVCLLIFGRNNGTLSKSQVSAYLKGFDNLSKEGDTDSLLLYFDKVRDTKNLKNMLSFLSGRTDFRGHKKVLAYINMDIEDSDIKILGTDYAAVNIPVKIVHDSIDSKLSQIVFKIHRTGPNQFKIIHYDAKKLLADYLTYEDYVKIKTAPREIFTPATLAAFKTAEQLKAKYDSVIWFAFNGDKTYFYVVKGKWNIQNDIIRSKDSVIDPYKMGLIGPDLKEIIPAEYDLIHNINGTFPNLVEVEKDNKKGFYDIDGKLALPVNYDQIFPIDGDENLAVLRNGDDYFYLKKDMTVSEKVDLKIADFFSKIKNINNPFDLYKNALSIVTEYNSKEENAAIYVPPSYLVDLNIIAKWENFKNPLRNATYDDAHEKYEVALNGSSKEAANWLEASFYYIRDYFLGGRSEFYDKKNIVIVDKKRNKIFTQEIETDYSPGGGNSLKGECDINTIKVINDSLFEVKSGAVLWVQLYDSTKYIDGGPYYHYLAIKNNKIEELPNNRSFGFTKYVKLDDSYLNSCYNISSGGERLSSEVKRYTVDHITGEMFKVMKNEIYADYAYQFKDKRWQEIFEDMPSYSDHIAKDKPNNVTVDDSLTEIDKYNINWINQKLKENKTKLKSNTLAAR
jgi:hypothetical protein